MDRVRRFIANEAKRQGKTLAEWSRAMPRNHAYLQQFIQRNVPANLPENARKQLARVMGVEEEKLRGDVHIDSEDLAASLHTAPDLRSEDIAATLPERRVKTVKVKGYVGASGEHFYYRLADQDFEEVPAPDNATDQTVAVEVRGKSLGPAFESWLVFYADVRSPVTPDMLNQLCVVGLADDRLLVKRIERKNGKLVLVSNNGEPDIVAPKIEWAAKVSSMRPR